MTAKLNFLAIFTFIVLGFYFFYAPPTSSDTYWHLSVGREVWLTKKIPTQDNFVYGSNPTNYPSTEWLSGLIFYWVNLTFGNYGMPILRTILGIITIIIFYKTLRLITENKWLASATCLVVGYVLGYRLFDRPESFSFVFMVLINFFLFQYLLKNKISNYIFLLPLIFLAWINIHAYFVLSVPFLFLFLIIAIARKDKKGLLIILSVTFLSIMTFITNFKTIFEFIAKSTKIYEVHIGEFDTLWQRLMITNGFDLLHQISLDIYVYLLVLIFYILGIFLKFKEWKKNILNLFIELFYLGFLFSPVKIIRMLTPAVLISSPFLFYLLNSYIKKYQNINLYIFKSIFIIFFIVLTFSIFDKDILGMRMFHSVVYTYSANHNPGSPVSVTNHLWTQTFPKGAENIINTYLNSKRIFTVNYWGNYFIWTVPKAKVFSDSMIAYKTPTDWDAENSLIYGAGDWQKNLEKYDIDTVVNNQPNVFIQNLTPVFKLDNWKLAYANDTFAIYARDTAIKKLPVDLSKIHLDLNTALKFKPEDANDAVEELEKLKTFDPKNAFARQQLVAYYVDNDLQKAQNLAEESRGLIPQNPYFILYMAELSAQKNDCSQAKQFIEETKRKSFGEFGIKMQIQSILTKCSN